jgi:anti-sigma factor RsiW
MSPDDFIPGEEHPGSGDVAAYALGALDPAEADTLQRHLTSCAICAEELRAYAGVVDDLATAVPRIEAPASLRRRVLRAVEEDSRSSAPSPALAGPSSPLRSGRARRRDAVVRSRTWLRGPTLALASGIGFALAAIIVVIIAVPGRPNGRTVRAATTLGGSAALHIAPDHTELVVHHVAAPPRGRIYEVWLQYGKGRPHPDALFGVDSRGSASVTVTGSIYGVSHLMVTTEPAPRGTRTPTTPPVITAALS